MTMNSKRPSYKDLQRAQEAESKKISDLIDAGYEFKQEMGKSPLKKFLGDDYREIIERNRRTMKKKGEK